jgi:hypothetical protein
MSRHGDDVVTLDRLERALTLAAYLVSLDGDAAVPIFERLEREYAAARANQDAKERAQQMLQTFKANNPQLLLPPTKNSAA